MPVFRHRNTEENVWGKKKKNEKTESKKADETKPEECDAEKLELYRFVHSFSEVALKSEMTRKSQILDQSRTIQTVFSIVSVALLSLVQPLFSAIAESGEYLRCLTVLFYFIAFGIQIAALILVGIAQHRRTLSYFPSPKKLKDCALENYDEFLKDLAKEEFKIDEFSAMYESLSNDNTYMVRLVNVANILVIVAICWVFLAAAIITFVYFK